MAGFNLQTYRERFRALVYQVNQSPKSMFAVNDSEIDTHINVALLEIQNKLNISSSRDDSQDIVQGQTFYELPASRQGTTIQSIQVIHGTGSGSRQIELRYLDHQSFVMLYNQATTANDSGEPRHWTYNPDFNQQILVRPVPQFSQTDALVVNFYPVPTQLFRIFNQALTTSTITAAVTYNSTSVTLSDNITLGQIVAFDEFGTVDTTQGDGSSAIQPSPSVWYGIAGPPTINVSTTTLVLSRPYEQPTNATARFMCAQVPDTEISAPSVLGFAPAYIAASRYLVARNPGLAEVLYTQGIAMLMDGRPKRPPQRIIRPFDMFDVSRPYVAQFGPGGVNNV